MRAHNTCLHVDQLVCYKRNKKLNFYAVCSKLIKHLEVLSASCYASLNPFLVFKHALYLYPALTHTFSISSIVKNDCFLYNICSWFFPISFRFFQNWKRTSRKENPLPTNRQTSVQKQTINGCMIYPECFYITNK